MRGNQMVVFTVVNGDTTNTLHGARQSTKTQGDDEKESLAMAVSQQSFVVVAGRLVLRGGAGLVA